MNISEYKYKTELHAHTMPGSACAELPPESVVRIYSQLGYTSIVITNHFHTNMRFYGDKEQALKAYLRDYHIACEYGNKYGINVILGCEIRFPESFNDYLLIGIDEKELYNAYDLLEKSLSEFSKQYRNKSHLIIQAHPFRKNMTLAPPNEIDGIETFNMHPGHNSRVGFAAQYAKQHDFIVTCGTDFHHNHHEGMISLLTKEPVTNSAMLADVLSSHDYLFDISGNIILPYGIDA